MKVHDCNWFMLKDYLKRDDRIVLPIGSTEQHGYLSVGADAIMAERVSIEAAESLGVPVLPALPFGVTPYFTAFPGSPSLRTDTLNAIIRDLLDSLHRQGFRRIAVINGHGGNSPARGVVREWLTERRRPRAQALFHDWWNAPRVWAVVQRYDSAAAHGSWMENFPWTRLSGVVMPKGAKQPLPATLVWQSPPEALRELTVDGVFGGSYERSDDEVLEVWRAGVAEVRDVIENGWANTA